MGTAVRPGVVAAPWLRRTGSGAFERAHRAIFAAGGAGQYPDLSALECGAVFPPATAAGAAQVEEAAGGVHAKEHAAASGCAVSAGRSDPSEVSAGDSGHGSAGCQTDSDLHWKNRTRTAHGAAAAKRLEHRHCLPRTDVPVPRGGTDCGTGE